MGNSSPFSTLILIALMVVAFYFLIIRPNKRRQQAQLRTMSSLTPGTRVLLTSGVFGTLVEVGQKQAVLELSPGVHLTVLKQAIARAVKDGDEDSPEDDLDTDALDADGFDADGLDAEPLHPLDTTADGSLDDADGSLDDADSDLRAQDAPHHEVARPGSLQTRGPADGSASVSADRYQRGGSDTDPRPGTNTAPIQD